MPKKKRQLKQVKVNRSGDFGFYFQIYAELNNWVVPEFHWEICHFLNNYQKWDDRTAVLQVFRSASKSTITGCWIAWLLTTDQSLRIKIISDTISIAEKMVRHAKSVIREHPLSSHLLTSANQRPIKGLEDTSKSFCVKGFSHARDSNVSCGGVGVSMTGSRCDIAIFDDVEASGNCLTQGSRESLNRTIGEALNLCDKPNDYHLFIGTPHSSDSIYPKEIKKGCSHLTLPLLSNVEGEFPMIKGKCLWPDKFDNRQIRKLQKDSNGKGHFLSQYQLIPYSVADTRFDINKLNIYHNDINYYYSDNKTHATLTIDDDKIDLYSVNAFWDPALSQSGTDDSVLAIVYSDLHGRYYIDQTTKLVGDLNEQIKQAVDIALERKLPHISVETNGIGSFVKEPLIKACTKHQIGVTGIAQSKRKSDRLIEAWEARLSSGLIYIKEDVHKGKLTSQLMDFNPMTIDKDQNDYIDAVGSAILDAPIMLHYHGHDGTGVTRNKMFNPEQQFEMKLESRFG